MKSSLRADGKRLMPAGH